MFLHNFTFSHLFSDGKSIDDRTQKKNERNVWTMINCVARTLMLRRFDKEIAFWCFDAFVSMFAWPIIYFEWNCLMFQKCLSMIAQRSRRRRRRMWIDDECKLLWFDLCSWPFLFHFVFLINFNNVTISGAKLT